MNRRDFSAEGIRKEIELRLMPTQAVSHAERIKMQLPERIMPDDTGGNWDAVLVSGGGEPPNEAYQVVEQVKEKYSLKE